MIIDCVCTNCKTKCERIVKKHDDDVKCDWCGCIMKKLPITKPPAVKFKGKGWFKSGGY